jgi:hypothetical protein
LGEPLEFQFLFGDRPIITAHCKRKKKKP